MYHVDGVIFQRRIAPHAPIQTAFQGTHEVLVDYILIDIQSAEAVFTRTCLPTELWAYTDEVEFTTLYSSEKMKLRQFVPLWKAIPWKKKCTT